MLIRENALTFYHSLWYNGVVGKNAADWILLEGAKMLHPILVMNALFGVPEGQKCEFCGKTNDVQVEQIGLYSAAWSCNRCRALGEVPNVSPDEQGTIRRSKKKRRETEETQPPSREWLIYQHRRKMFDQMAKLHGIAIDDLEESGEFSEWEKSLIKQFGRYRNDPTVGNFRCTDGTIIEPVEDEGVEVELFAN